MLREGAHVNDVNIFGETPLLWAVYGGNSEILEELLKRRANVHVKDHKNNRPLHFAAREGYTDCIKLLVEHGADIKEKDEEGFSATYTALANKKKEAFKFLLSKEPNINQKNKNGVSLFAGTIHIFPDFAVEFLNRYNPDINTVTTNGSTPLISAIHTENQGLVKALIQHGAQINQETTMNNAAVTPLLYAINNQSKSMVELLIQLRCDVNYTPRDEIFSPIFFASKKCNKDIIELLIAGGADLKQPAVINDKEYSPLYFYLYFVAFLKGFNEEILELFLSKGAPIDHDSFSLALNQKSLPALRALFKYGYKIDVSKIGYLPFCKAAKDKEHEIIRLFLEGGEIISKKDLLRCILNSDMDAFQILLGYNPDLNGYYGYNTLLTAIISADPPIEKAGEFIKALVEAGADINQPNKGNATPLRCANIVQDVQIIELLQSLGADPA